MYDWGFAAEGVRRPRCCSCTRGVEDGDGKKGCDVFDRSEGLRDD